MSITFGSAAKSVCYAVLFVVVAVVTTIGCGILLFMFLGAALLSLAGFGVLPRMPPSTFESMEGWMIAVYVVTSAVAGLAGIYSAAHFVARIRRQNIAHVERVTAYIATVMMWIILTVLLTFGMSLFIAFGYGIMNGADLKSSPDYHGILQDARYVLLAAFILSGILAAESLTEE